MRLLYHLPLSPYGRKVRLALAEKRLAFEVRIEKPWERRPEYLELNPSGSVPTLVEENGLAVPDSGVICEYLDEAYPDTPLLGHTFAERVEVRRLVAWLDGKFAQEVTRWLYGEKIIKRLSGSGQPDAAALRVGFLNLKTHLQYIGYLAESQEMASRQCHDPGRPDRGRAPFHAGFLRRRRLAGRAGSPRLVCPDEVPSVLPSDPCRPRAGRHAARALRQPGLLNGRFHASRRLTAAQISDGR